MLLEYDLSLTLVTLILFTFLIYVWDRFFSLQGLPSNLPWAGAESNNPLSRAKSCLRSFFGLKGLIENGYYKYSKKNRAFVLPNVVTGPEVILPMSQMDWLLNHPDNVLSQHEVNKEFLDAGRTMLHPHVSRDAVHGRVIRRELTKDLDLHSESIVEEIDDVLDANWGTDPNEWRDVVLYDTMLDVISRISNRVLVGIPLCRNKDYLKRSSTFLKSVVIVAGVINLLPAMLRPLLAPIIMAYDLFQYRMITKYIFPILEERAAAFEPGLDYKRPDYSKHNDYIQWALHDAFSHDDPLDRTPQMIVKRLAVLSFAAIQSSVITISNTLFDIAASPSCVAIQQSIREEVTKVTAECSGEEWSRASLAEMHRLDSALRESMRLWGFISRGVMKKVVVPEGITIPSGEHLPYGTNVGVTMYAIHHDESAYPNALVYDAFRFSRALEDPEMVEDMCDSKDEAARAPTMVTSSDKFMGFSYGRHACPGRFFAANQLKLLLAAIVTKYEIEPIEERPTNPWLNNSIGPPLWEKIRIRRRPESVNVDAASPANAEVAVATGKSDLAPERVHMGFTHGIIDPKILQRLSAIDLHGIAPAVPVPA